MKIVALSDPEMDFPGVGPIQKCHRPQSLQAHIVSKIFLAESILCYLKEEELYSSAHMAAICASS